MRKILLALTLSLAFTSWSQSHKDTARLFPADSLQLELDFVYDWLKGNHPALYAYCTKAKADKLYQTLRRKINRPMNALEFYQLTSPFIAAFQDGHTYLYAGASLQ